MCDAIWQGKTEICNCVNGKINFKMVFVNLSMQV